jgi:hypothetical protein
MFSQFQNELEDLTSTKEQNDHLSFASLIFKLYNFFEKHKSNNCEFPIEFINLYLSVRYGNRLKSDLFSFIIELFDCENFSSKTGNALF